MNAASMMLFVAIGFISGIASGMFGIGGGVLIIPALVYFAGFSQHAATGTSLAILLPPVGLAAVLEYYRHGHVELKTAAIIAAALFVGGWVGAVIAGQVSGPYLRLGFAMFVVCMGLYMLFGALRRLGWI
jgi:uncharacterized membrane protein YfcA